MALSAEMTRRLSAAARRADESRETRNRLISEAHDEGGGLREIGRAVGLSHQAVAKILSGVAKPKGKSRAE